MAGAIDDAAKKILVEANYEKVRKSVKKKLFKETFNLRKPKLCLVNSFIWETIKNISSWFYL